MAIIIITVATIVATGTLLLAYITNIALSETGSWACLACLKHISLGFDRPKLHNPSSSSTQITPAEEL
jgi:hypothetical protein